MSSHQSIEKSMQSVLKVEQVKVNSHNLTMLQGEALKDSMNSLQNLGTQRLVS